MCYPTIDAVEFEDMPRQVIVTDGYRHPDIEIRTLAPRQGSREPPVAMPVRRGSWGNRGPGRPYFSDKMKVHFEIGIGSGTRKKKKTKKKKTDQPVLIHDRRMDNDDCPPPPPPPPPPPLSAPFPAYYDDGNGYGSYNHPPFAAYSPPAYSYPDRGQSFTPSMPEQIVEVAPPEHRIDPSSRSRVYGYGDDFDDGDGHEVVRVTERRRRRYAADADEWPAPADHRGVTAPEPPRQTIIHQDGRPRRRFHDEEEDDAVWPDTSHRDDRIRVMSDEPRDRPGRRRSILIRPGEPRPPRRARHVRWDDEQA
ncbi:MAG: hypothetical protein M1815_000665 [Lichina confinis]|nr:MAG: hypothetical protein M1815_000665 [Lichina confinis]